jgi:hypothetical protein
MATAKASPTLDRKVLSGHVDRSLRHQLQRDRLIGLLDDLEKEAGPIEPEVMEQVRRAWLDPTTSRPPDA